MPGTKSPEQRAQLQRPDDIRALGAQAVVVDAFDLEALKAATTAAKPDVVIHQLTDLPDVIDPDKMPAALAANARLRIEGTYNLIVAAKSAGARRFIAQSIAFMYAPGKPPYRETDPLVPASEGPGGASARGVHALEGAVLGTPGIDGIVLRYGRLYGPGTWAQKPERSGISPHRRRGAGRAAGGNARRSGHLQRRRR